MGGTGHGGANGTLGGVLDHGDTLRRTGQGALERTRETTRRVRDDAGNRVATTRDTVSNAGASATGAIGGAASTATNGIAGSVERRGIRGGVGETDVVERERRSRGQCDGFDRCDEARGAQPRDAGGAGCRFEWRTGPAFAAGAPFG